MFIVWTFALLLQTCNPPKGINNAQELANQSVRYIAYKHALTL